jgi:hypothetical protein
MNFQNYFETLKEQKTIERNYKLSLENYKKEVVYQAYCEVIDFLVYIHQQGYRRADGNPVNINLDDPHEFKSSVFNKIKWNGGESLYLDDEISSFVIQYKNDGIQIECMDYNGTKKYFTTVESFIKKIADIVLDTFVIVDTPKEDSETSEWSQIHF